MGRRPGHGFAWGLLWVAGVAAAPAAAFLAVWLSSRETGLPPWLLRGGGLLLVLAVAIAAVALALRTRRGGETAPTFRKDRDPFGLNALLGRHPATYRAGLGLLLILIGVGPLVWIPWHRSRPANWDDGSSVPYPYGAIAFLFLALAGIATSLFVLRWVRRRSGSWIRALTAGLGALGAVAVAGLGYFRALDLDFDGDSLRRVLRGRLLVFLLFLLAEALWLALRGDPGTTAEDSPAGARDGSAKRR